MKRIAFALIVIGLVFAQGCAALTGTKKGGLIAAVQTADDAIAAKYGVSPQVVAKVREFVGMPDVRVDPLAGYQRQLEFFKDGQPYDLVAALAGVTVVESFRKVSTIDQESVIKMFGAQPAPAPGPASTNAVPAASP